MSGFDADGSDNFAIDGISDSDNPLLGPLEGAPTFNVPAGVNPMTYEPGGLAPSLVVTPGGSTETGGTATPAPAAGSSLTSWLQYLFSPGGPVIPQAEGAGANPLGALTGTLTGGLLGGTGTGSGGGWEAWAGEAIIRATISIVGLVLVGSGFYLAGRRGSVGVGQITNPAPALRALR